MNRLAATAPEAGQDYLLDAEARAFRHEVRAAMARELAPLAEAIENDNDWEAVKTGIAALGRAGYLRPMFPDHYSGPLSAPGLVHQTIVSEEAAAVNYAFETTIGSALSCAYPLAHHAAPAVRDARLAGILDGTEIGAICVTEPNVGSDSAGMETRIRFDETAREWVIDGFKRYISNASVADTYIVYGITDDTVPAQKGMTALVVPAGTSGMTFPRTYTFMGRRGCIVGEVAFENCRVPEDHLLGKENGGFRIMLEMFNFERIILAGAALGVARTAFSIATQHAQTRDSFGQKLGCKQLIWDMVAEMSWRIDSAELLTYRAAQMYDRGVSGKELMKPAAMAKLVATEIACFCADRTVQILGGDGITKEYGRAEQLFRDTRAMPIVAGTTEMAKYLIASRDLPNIKPNL
ncbi:acyl-CoA dehydrogenase family protein [Arenibaculum sp.]|jgi:alkylation response protein AidB-like acyl-CoA dehydrogenase|uniref:acyl-CoA dehydrogenase family protein n=1 Tax=Arenibaculum sp. TaxID=2865862 RepID=UPI002E14C312|nr:acyl-CoA dehydrogenase family protein [Arenibaculum sp.]